MDRNNRCKRNYRWNTFKWIRYITIIIKELNAPLGYKIGDTKTYRVYRDRNTGEVQAVDAGVNIGNPNNDWSIIKVMPIDEQLDNKFTLELNKIVEASNTYITSSQAKFKTEIKQVDNDGNIIYQDTIGDMYTNRDGIARVSNIDIPNVAGEYELTNNRGRRPVGYEKLKDPLKYKLRVTEQSNGKMKIDSISGDNKYAKTIFVRDQYIALNVENPVDDQLSDDEYSLDITKVDAETGLGIDPMAVFKVNLPDTKNTDLYVETQRNQLGLPGKLEYCYIEEKKILVHV